MNTHQIDILRLAWARELGLSDDESMSPADRITLADPDARRIRFVVLDGRAVLTGPPDVIERADSLGNDALATRAVLLDLAGDRRGRCAGPFSLAYADEVEGVIGVADPLVGRSSDHLRTLAGLSPPDDVTDAGLDAATTLFTVLDDTDGEDAAAPASCAGYREWHGFLADMGVLTAPSHRRRGYGLTAARLATNDAIDSGLVPQWATRLDNHGARLLADSLGYVELGILMEVNLV